ncbi:hypothetical protein FBY10_10190 [Pseudomonas sp. SJZ103]|uniref:hypothetical protein n=1 Tax=unclassified Pseudomonas TaxID=196821 RepID=UPI0011A5EDE1|nr:MULTISPECIES: hypothetical protein [unclassified Pseudomonas]TWC74400.1 hypothetical protein FBY10_10190 [Pseudomonas sp. SJZ103]TWC93471.1 hypothetical protein FBY08_101968 [Pseudomonas sp. SJZ094]
MSMTNIERFNVLVGVVFAKLYETFPVPVELSVQDFAEQLVDDDEQVDDSEFMKGGYVKFFTSTISWLDYHGYLRKGSTLSGGTVRDCVLTASTLEILNAMPANLEIKSPSLGDQLVSATKDSVKGKVKELAGELLSKAVVFGAKAAMDFAKS